MYVFLNTNDDRAELKAHKSMSRTVTLIYTRVKYLGVKKGEGICWKGTYFWKLTVYASQSIFEPHH